jgi:hypothetical protein
MSKLTFLISIVIAAPVLLASSCKRTSGGTCGKDVACTMMFAMVTAEVNDPTMTAIPLEVYTLRKSTGEKITHDQTTAQSGRYIVLDDGYQKKLQQATDTFVFVGTRSGAKVFEEQYVISADCCHINKVSGKDVIQFN